MISLCFMLFAFLLCSCWALCVHQPISVLFNGYIYIYKTKKYYQHQLYLYIIYVHMYIYIYIYAYIYISELKWTKNELSSLAAFFKILSFYTDGRYFAVLPLISIYIYIYIHIDMYIGGRTAKYLPSAV